jgi:phosphate transport system protein
MAGMAEEMIKLTISAYSEKSDLPVSLVSSMDETMDTMELKLEQTCLDLLALQSPLASDLRLVTSAIRILTDIERVGDHCVNIVHRAPMLNHLQPVLPTGLLENLGSECMSMIRRSVEAFVASDPKIAREVITDDDKVDDLYNHCYNELLRLMVSDPLCIERASHLIVVIINWERIADMATNIAEEVLFIIEGVNAKHQYLRHDEPKS